MAGAKFRAIEQAFDLIRRLAFLQRQPCEQPGAGHILAPVPGQPPAKPRMMPQKRIEQI
jgi:hypothetical protein